jgi:hypothetical protein
MITIFWSIHPLINGELLGIDTVKIFCTDITKTKNLAICLFAVTPFIKMLSFCKFLFIMFIEETSIEVGGL